MKLHRKMSLVALFGTTMSLVWISYAVPEVFGWVATTWRHFWEDRPRFGGDETRPIDGTHVAKTRDQLVAELGEPHREREGVPGLPPPAFLARYPGCQTLIWTWPSGSFEACIYPTNGAWVCFQSWWIPKGCVMD